MSLGEVRDGIEAYRTAADREADDLKDPMLASGGWSTYTLGWGEPERALADQVPVEWLLSGDENKRYDAVASVRRFHLTAVTKSLRALVVELASSDDPGASFEREKFSNLIAELEGDHGPS